MSYFLDEDQVRWRGLARTFAHEDVEPVADLIDAEQRTPSELIARAAELGLFALYLPKEHGGHGERLTTVGLVLEEIAKASPGLAGMMSVQMVLAPASVMSAGTDEQKARLLPPSARGQRLLAYSQTEPSGAMNVAAHVTTLTADGDAFRLNGRKLYCTQGEAQTYLVMCVSAVPGEEGYGAVIVDRAAEGFTVEPNESKLGWRGTNTRGIRFDDVLIRREDVLGKLSTGSVDLWADANEPNFVTHAITSLGAAQGLFDKTLKRVKERELYGAPMFHAQPIAYWLSQIYTKLAAMRSLAYTATQLIDEGRPERAMMGSVCKSYICETAFECTTTLQQIWGGSGIMDSTGVNRYLRDARTNMVAEGANEMHLSMVGQQVLELA